MAGSVLAADPSARFSHVGLILRHDGELVVVHAVPDDWVEAGGVIVEPIVTFFNPDVAVDYAVFRPLVLTARQQALVRETALEQLGLPFDFDMRLSDASEVYCTELVLRAFGAAEIGLGEGLREVRTVMMSEPALAPDSLRGSTLLRDVTPLVTTTGSEADAAFTNGH
jgi:hypothetical protein